MVRSHLNSNSPNSKEWKLLINASNLITLFPFPINSAAILKQLCYKKRTVFQCSTGNTHRVPTKRLFFLVWENIQRPWNLTLFYVQLSAPYVFYTIAILKFSYNLNNWMALKKNWTHLFLPINKTLKVVNESRPAIRSSWLS